MNKLEKIIEEHKRVNIGCDICDVFFNYRSNNCASAMLCPDIEDLYSEFKRLESQKVIELSNAEKTVLESIDEDFRWIVRDESENVCIFENRPEREYIQECWISKNEVPTKINCFNHMFLFIKSDDEKPYNIQELLRGV